MTTYGAGISYRVTEVDHEERHGTGKRTPELEEEEEKAGKTTSTAALKQIKEVGEAIGSGEKPLSAAVSCSTEPPMKDRIWK